MGVLDDAAVRAALAELPGWQRDGNRIVKTFTYDEFRSAMLFVNRVADAANALGQYPDIDVRWTSVTLSVSAHAAGGLTEADLALAHRIERLVGDHAHPPGLAGSA